MLGWAPFLLNFSLCAACYCLGHAQRVNFPTGVVRLWGGRHLHVFSSLWCCYLLFAFFKGKASIVTGVVCHCVPANAAAALRCAGTGHSAGKALSSLLPCQKIFVHELMPCVQDRLVDEGYNPAYGARPLRRAIMRLLEDSMAERMLAGDIKARAFAGRACVSCSLLSIQGAVWTDVQERTE